MEEFRPPPDFSRDPLPPERPEGHIGFVVLALVIMLVFWWSYG